MTKDNDVGLPWEDLVTEGHVRAARLRAVRPWLLTFAIVLLVGGQFAMGMVKPPAEINERERILGDYIQHRQWLVLEAFSGLPAPRVTPSEARTLVTHATTVTLHQEALAELNRVGDLPRNPTVNIVTPSAFWRAPWPKGRLIATGEKDVRLMGGLINVGDAEYPIPARIIIVYRRHGDAWSAVTVTGPEFMGLPDTSGVMIETLPVTLKPVLKLKERG